MSAAAIRTVVVDDEPLARMRLRTLLSDHADFALVAECADGTEALAAIARERPALIFLDIQMAELDGLAVARAVDVDPPPAIVFVTAYDRYAVPAFELRALDYLLKPFDERRFVEALQRVRAHRTTEEMRAAHARLLATLRELSRGAIPPPDAAAGGRSSSLLVGDLAVDLRARTVRRAGAALSLRPREFDLLAALLRRAGEVVTRRELLNEVWGYAEGVESRTIDTHVSELRRKLGHAPGEPGHITTVARIGYRLEA